MAKIKHLLSLLLNPKNMFFGFVCVALILLFIVGVFPNNDTVVINSEKSKPYNSKWTLENTGEIINLPYAFPVKADEVVTISKMLTNDFGGSAMSMSFISSLQTVKISIGGNPIYEYCQNPDNYFDVQPPPAWHVVRLSPDMLGKKLEISFSSPSDNYGGVLNGIEIGTKQATVSTFMESKYLSLAVCFAIMIFGIFAITVYFFMNNNVVELNGVFYLGAFSILVALWSSCETKALQGMTGNVQLIMFTSFLSMMLFPIPLLLFFKEGFNGIIRKIYDGFLIFYGGYFILSVIMQVFNIMDFNRLYPFFVMAMGGTILFICTSVIIAYEKNKCSKTKLPVIAMCVLLIFTAMDFGRYFANGAMISEKDTSFYIRFGILFMIFTLGYSSIRQMIGYYDESTKAGVYKYLAHTDSLSNLKNRTYLLDVYPKVFADSVRDNTAFSVIMVDIDNFKSYNDNYGHSAGDDVIRAVSGVLRHAAARRPLDAAIRYGGEEFLIILPKISLDGVIHVAELIKMELDKLKLPHEYSKTAPIITVSQGVYSNRPRAYDTLESFIERADRALYESKRRGRNRYTVYEAEDFADEFLERYEQDNR